jgi:hypothetical protein
MTEKGATMRQHVEDESAGNATSAGTSSADSGKRKETFGSSTDQHVTGHDETGTFVTDEQPGYTPSHGSGNAGINLRHANREPAEDDRP